MKNKARARQTQPVQPPASEPSAFEKKVKALGQKIRSNPSIIGGAIVIAYCVYRVVFDV